MIMKNPSHKDIVHFYYKVYKKAIDRWSLDKATLTIVIDEELKNGSADSLREFVHFFLGLITLIENRHENDKVQPDLTQRILEEKSWLMSYNVELGVRPLDVMRNAKGIRIMRDYMDILV